MVVRRFLFAFVATTFLGTQALPARADNPMGYALITQQDAASLPRNGGALGMRISRADRITSGGMTFDLLRVDAVNRGSAGAQAGFSAGDQIVSVDGRVFESLQAFAAYVGSLRPGTQAGVDIIPAGGGPQQAQRVGVTVGAGGRAVSPAPDQPAQQQGMSTGTKLAIGAAAVALFGCYEIGCFKRKQPVMQQPGAPNAGAGGLPTTITR